jgi:hypothetical protein
MLRVKLISEHVKSSPSRAIFMCSAPLASVQTFLELVRASA